MFRLQKAWMSRMTVGKLFLHLWLLKAGHGEKGNVAFQSTRCSAGELFDACEDAWRLLARRLLRLKAAIDDAEVPSISSLQQSGFSSVPMHSGTADHSADTVSAVSDVVRKAEAEVLSKLRHRRIDDIVRALADAKELFAFLRPLLNEDLLPLQDAVEEHSDELIRADTIFALLDIQRFFRQLLRRTTRSARVRMKPNVQGLRLRGWLPCLLS